MGLSVGVLLITLIVNILLCSGRPIRDNATGASAGLLEERWERKRAETSVKTGVKENDEIMLETESDAHDETYDEAFDEGEEEGDDEIEEGTIDVIDEEKDEEIGVKVDEGTKEESHNKVHDELEIRQDDATADETAEANDESHVEVTKRWRTKAIKRTIVTSTKRMEGRATGTGQER